VIIGQFQSTQIVSDEPRELATIEPLRPQGDSTLVASIEDASVAPTAPGDDGAASLRQAPYVDEFRTALIRFSEAA
jgi:hypothetical protein